MRHLVNYNILVVLKQFVEKTDQTRAEWSRYLSIIFVSALSVLSAPARWQYVQYGARLTFLALPVLTLTALQQKIPYQFKG